MSQPQPNHGSSLASALVTGLALASAGAGVIHLSTAGEHPTTIGIAFMVMGIAQLIWAGLMVITPARPIVLLGLVLHGTIVVTWLTSRTGGLPLGPDAGHPDAIGIKDLSATVLEVIAIAGALLLIGTCIETLHTRIAPLSALVLPPLTVAAVTMAAVLSPHSHADDHAHPSVVMDDSHQPGAHDHTVRATPPGHAHLGKQTHVLADGRHPHMGSDTDHHDSPVTTSHPPNGHGHDAATDDGHTHDRDEDHPHDQAESDHLDADHGAHVQASGGPYPYTWLWDPAVVEISSGQMVEWANPTDSLHHVTFYSGPSRRSLHVAPDGEASMVFRKPGTYLYRCNLGQHSEITQDRCLGQCGSISVAASSKGTAPS